MSGARNEPPIDFVRGDATGILIPAHGDALRTGGADFLTEAFRAFGWLAPDNRVTQVTRLETCPGGSTGAKLFLSVAYEKPAPGLHTDLFVKFSRDFTDKLRDDRGKHEMESEARFAALSRVPGFPISVPAVAFADYHHDSHTGLLITQRIAFGRDGIEPHHTKCHDFQLTEPVAYYRVIVRSLARIAAAHRSGRLSPDIATRFPFDAEAAARVTPIAHTAAQLRERVARYAAFAATCPQLLPASIRTPEFIAKLDRDVARFREHESAINRFQQSDPDFIALIHWNANIDNAWFWRDAAGALQCGLIDWGRVGQMNVAFALWGCLGGAAHEVWDHHIDELLALFADEFHQGGGPRLDVAELKFHLALHVALMALFYFLDSPERIQFRLPEAMTASDPLDPVFEKSETARNQLHFMTVVLKFWLAYDFGAALDRLLQRLGDTSTARR